MIPALRQGTQWFSTYSCCLRYTARMAGARPVHLWEYQDEEVRLVGGCKYVCVVNVYALKVRVKIQYSTRHVTDGTTPRILRQVSALPHRGCTVSAAAEAVTLTNQT
ncbi:hypothetical protein EX30DRAFT_173617 [Ascodesmis nigricans]|uniref:Uncharacterized protein n=1 Tax=Ascodesmis nigricans TaxID=341454 RepID=A0A4S2MLQ2_9PEZI|nr:hypothetical protein EX30DRAFT_173617 [Ascodesmis nigricans]